MRPIATLLTTNSRAPFVPSRRTFVCSLPFALMSMRLTAQQRPRRIVSTAPSITEALFALGLGDEVVGVSRYCDYPAQVTKLPKVGSYLKPDVEAIARLAPDLVVLQTAPAELTDRLKALRIGFVEVPHGTLDDVYAGIEMIARAASVPERANQVTGSMRSALQAIQTKARTMPSPRVIAILDRRQGTLTDLTAVGPGNYVNQMLEIAGATNVLAKPGLPRYPHIALETIVREDPDVILDLSSPQESEAMRQQERPAVIALWAQNRGLKAVQSNRIFFGTSNALLVPGPRAPEAARLLFEAMHGTGRTAR